MISEGEGGRANIICERSLREAVKKMFCFFVEIFPK